LLIAYSPGGNPRDPRITSAYQKSVECYKACAKLFDPPIEPVEIPYENTTLPGYFHRVDRSDLKRPLLIIHSGFDGGAAQEVHDNGARAAVERGYNVLAFDGPGQFGPPSRRTCCCRPADMASQDQLESRARTDCRFVSQIHGEAQGALRR
jgi:pimeloyl-ACP methyl ester carboxylesterase